MAPATEWSSIVGAIHEHATDATVALDGLLELGDAPVRQDLRPALDQLLSFALVLHRKQYPRRHNSSLNNWLATLGVTWFVDLGFAVMPAGTGALRVILKCVFCRKNMNGGDIIVGPCVSAETKPTPDTFDKLYLHGCTCAMRYLIALGGDPHA